MSEALAAIATHTSSQKDRGVLLRHDWILSLLVANLKFCYQQTQDHGEMLQRLQNHR